MSRSTKTNLKQSNNDNPFYDLRKMVFSLNVGTLGLEVVKSGISLCTVMEWEISGSVATLVSVIDGSTSLYLSTGGE